jgi:hypothetical protein
MLPYWQQAQVAGQPAGQTLRFLPSDPNASWFAGTDRHAIPACCPEALNQFLIDRANWFPKVPLPSFCLSPISRGYFHLLTHRLLSRIRE